MTSIRQIRRDNENRIDYGIILNVMVLAIIGLLSVYSTTTLIEGGDLVPTLFHALWYGVGTIAVIAAMQLDSEKYWKLATYIRSEKHTSNSIHHSLSDDLSTL